jgi:hypothetical protein
MNPRRRLSCLLVAVLVAAAPALAATNAWQRVSQKHGVSVFRRDHAGSGVKEVRALGRIDAGWEKLEGIVDDVVIFQDIIPYMSSSDVLSRQGDSVISHHVIDLPKVSPRDVVVRLSKQESTTPDGRKVLTINFTSVKGGPPPAAGIVRMESLTGRARMVAQPNGDTTVDLRIYAEPGGSIPATLVNMATTHAAPMVIDNLEAVAKGEKVAGR